MFFSLYFDLLRMLLYVIVCYVVLNSCVVVLCLLVIVCLYMCVSCIVPLCVNVPCIVCPPCSKEEQLCRILEVKLKIDQSIINQC